MDYSSLTLKNRIKVGRAEKNYTQECLGKLVGTTRQSIALIEAGKHSPSVNLAYRISKALDKRFDELFFEEDINEKKSFY